MAQTLKFGNGTWATKKGSTLAYNDEDGNYKPLPFTYTGAGKGTRVNKQGLIEVVENDRPRIDYTDSEDGALLLEPIRSNLITYSSDLSVLSKVSVGIASVPLTTSNYGIAPDGTMTATRVVFNLNGGTTNQDRSILRQSISTGDYYLSIYVKSTNGTEQKVMWHDGSEFNTTTVTNEWIRITYDSRSGVSWGGIALNGTSGVDSSDILVWGFQVEVGNVSSYIPTQGSIQTRVAETASGSGNSEVFNDSEGVLYFEFKNTDTSNYKLISISDGTINNRIFIGTRLSTGYIYYYVVSGGVNQALYISTQLAYNFTKVAVKYKANDFSFWINGLKVSTDSTGSTPIGLDSLKFNGGSGTLDFYGKTKEIGYYNTVLTDAELQALTT